MEGGYHGCTGFALAATTEFGDKFAPLAPGFSKVPFGNIEALAAAIEEDTAAVIMETIPATATDPFEASSAYVITVDIVNRAPEPDILAPLAGDKAADQVPYFLGKASHALGKYNVAIAYYQDYLSRFGMNLEILNLLGTAHYRSGDKIEALAAWKKSLEINGSQEDIKKLVREIQDEPRP